MQQKNSNSMVVVDEVDGKRKRVTLAIVVHVSAWCESNSDLARLRQELVDESLSASYNIFSEVEQRQANSAALPHCAAAQETGE